MDMTWYGQACFRMRGKAGTVVFDPFTPDSTGLKLPRLTADIVCLSHDHADHNNVKGIQGSPFIIRAPGEYEVKGVNVTAVSTFHDNKQGEERGKNLVMAVHLDGLSIVHLGDLGHVLTEEQKEKIGPVDILLIPVGGVYTIDARVAMKVVAQAEARIVIPMHFKIEGLAFDLEPVDAFLKEMGKNGGAPLPKLSIKAGSLPEEQEIVLLEKA